MDNIQTSLPKFHFINVKSNYELSVLLYESESNQIITMSLLAKWLKKYMDKSIVVNTNFSLSDLSDNIIQKIIDENYNFIKTKFLTNKFFLKFSFKNQSKKDIIKSLKEYNFDTELSTYISNDEQLYRFKRYLTILARKETIYNLI